MRKHLFNTGAFLPRNIAKFLRTPILKKIYGRLLLKGDAFQSNAEFTENQL